MSFFFYSKIFILKVQTVDKHNRNYLAEKQSNWNSLFISSSTWDITLQKEFIFLQLHCENRVITSLPALKQKTQLIAGLTHIAFFAVILQDGELVLLDGGCEFSCYVSDITRTWPVNGKYAAISFFEEF